MFEIFFCIFISLKDPSILQFLCPFTFSEPSRHTTKEFFPRLSLSYVFGIKSFYTKSEPVIKIPNDSFTQTIPYALHIDRLINIKNLHSKNFLSPIQNWTWWNDERGVKFLVFINFPSFFSCGGVLSLPSH